MNTRAFRFFLLTIAAVFIHYFTVQAGMEEFTKTIQKEYPITANSELAISNKYGDVQIQNWDQKSFKIVVKIMVDVKDRKVADDLLSMLNVDFSQEGDRITATTKIEDSFGRSRGWFGGDFGKRFSINYTVYMPKTNNLHVDNKYGNIFIDEMSGFVDIDLKYGSMTINKLSREDDKPMNQVVMAYSKGNIVECKWLKLQVSYSKIDIDRSKAIILISKYSKGSIGKASSLVADNSYDGYQIGEIGNFVVVGKYSNFQVKYLSKKIDLDVKYTDVSVGTVSKTFENIDVTSKYGKINLGIEPGASYYLDGYAGYTSIDYPTENSRVNRINENVKMTVKGTIGSNPKGSVKINTEYGGVRLMP